MRWKSLAKEKLFYLLITVFIVILSACIKPPAVNDNLGIKTSNQPAGGQVAILNNDIIITKPLSNDVISSPLEIIGRGGVLKKFISFSLRDSWDQIITTSSAMINPSASTWGDYQAHLEFSTPSSQTGWLEVYTIDSQDGSVQNLIRLPVVFKDYKKPVVKIYFSNIKEDPDLTDCSKVYPIERELESIQPSKLIITTIDELLKGLAEEDIANGFVTNIPEEGVKAQKLEIKDNTFYIDFNQALQEGVAGSCRVIAIRSQITETLKQFPGVEKVVISIDGKTQGILQP